MSEPSERDEQDLSAMAEDSGIDLSQVPPEHRHDIERANRLGILAVSIVPGASLLLEEQEITGEPAIVFTVSVTYEAKYAVSKLELMLAPDDHADRLVGDVSRRMREHILNELKG